MKGLTKASVQNAKQRRKSLNGKLSQHTQIPKEEWEELLTETTAMDIAQIEMKCNKFPWTLACKTYMTIQAYLAQKSVRLLFRMAAEPNSGFLL